MGGEGFSDEAGLTDEVLLGFETSDDAALFKLDDERVAVLTLDFLTPVVDNPFEFGRIAAANALSDIYAMGARPLVALNILTLSCSLGTEIAAEILKGGASAVREAGAFIVGGHTVDDDEPKYGLSVFGTSHPDRILRNSGAQAGDLLYLSKPLGTGIMGSAYRAGLEDEEGFRPAIESMMELNAKMSDIMQDAGAHAATDITGFGLAGHLHEMMEASGTQAVLNWDAVPRFPGVDEYSRQYCRPARSFTIEDYVEPFIERGDTDADSFDTMMGILCDPQTSGGLLIALPPDQAPFFEEQCLSRAGKELRPIGIVEEGASGRISFGSHPPTFTL